MGVDAGSRRWIALGLVALAAVHCTDRTPERPPNIVVLFTDDLGFCDLRLDRCQGVPTPSMRSIAEAGVLFTDAYVPSPTCSPSRAGLLTGRYPQRFGFEFNVTRFHEHLGGLPESELTLAEALGQAGYATGMVGKWHLGMAAAFRPLGHGFSEFYGFLGGNHSNFPENEKGAGRRALRRQDTPVSETGYLNDVFTREATGFLERHAHEPFFLYVAYNLPHTPLEADPRYLERFADVEDEEQRSYDAMVAALDDGIGALLAKLDALGLREETLVLFLNDNGCFSRSGYCRNPPFRGGKFLHFEGGVRVPFAIRWPARIPPGSVYGEPVSALDVFPTALSAAGVPLPEGRRYDGVDLLPYVRGERAGSPHEFLFWRNGINKAVRSGTHKLVIAGGSVALYDLSRDPSESTDIAAREPSRVAALVEALAEWETGLAAPAWPPRRLDVELSDGRVIRTQN